MQFTKISCTGSYVPEKQLTNEELSTMMETSDEWIRSRTGIQSRFVVANENTSDLCIKVAEKLLSASNRSAEELDFIIVATMTPDYTTPSVACQVQGHIQASKAFAFDIHAACSGFVYGLSMGDKLIQTGKRLGMIIGGETLSKIIDWQDRSTAVLFGDGAAGVLIEASEKQHILAEKLVSDGQRGHSLKAGFVENHSPFSTITETPDSFYLKMNGREIYDFSLKDVVKNILEVVDDSVDYLLLHQANKRIIEKIAKKVGIPREKFLVNVERYGNTSAATIPLLLDESVKTGTLTLGENQKIVLTGYGGGLTWGSILLTL